MTEQRDDDAVGPRTVTVERGRVAALDARASRLVSLVSRSESQSKTVRTCDSAGYSPR